MSRASNKPKQHSQQYAWAHVGAAMALVVVGLWLAPSALRAEWIDPFQAPPGNTYTITPIFADGTNQTKPATLTVGGNFSVGDAGGAAQQACINNICYGDLLDALANADAANYLTISATGHCSNNTNQSCTLDTECPGGTCVAATTDIGPVKVLGNQTLYHAFPNPLGQCVGLPCNVYPPGPPFYSHPSEPTSGTELDIVDFQMHRSQPPLGLVLNFIENYTCSVTEPNTSTFCYDNRSCSSTNVCSNDLSRSCTSSGQCVSPGVCNVSACGFRTVCANDNTRYCMFEATNSPTCGGAACIKQGMHGNVLSIIFTMSDGSKRTVSNILGFGGPTTSTTVGPTGGRDSEYLSVNAAAAYLGQAWDQTIYGITIDYISVPNLPPKTDLTLTKLQISWVPVSGPSSKIRSVVVTSGSFYFANEPNGLVPAFNISEDSLANNTKNSFAAFGNNISNAFPSHGIRAYHREIGGAALLSHTRDSRCTKLSALKCSINTDCVIGNTSYGPCIDIKFFVGENRCTNDLLIKCTTNANCPANGVCSPIVLSASAGEFRGKVRLTGAGSDLYLFSKDTTSGGTQTIVTPANVQLGGDLRLPYAFGNICLYGTSVCSNNANLVCTKNTDCVSPGVCVGKCINEWADIRTLYPPANSSRWAAGNNGYATYLKRTTDNQKLNIGGKEQDKNSEFIFNQAASKLVVGIPTNNSVALHTLTCGDGACNGDELCGVSDSAPNCTTDCGICTDTTPPADVLVTVIDPDDTTITLYWDEPADADFAGTLILRHRSPPAVYPDTNPVNGVDYALGQALGNAGVKAKVICGGPGGTCQFTDTNPARGVYYYYELYAYDTSLNYAPDNSANTRAYGYVDSGGGGGGCFLKDTPVLMADGTTKTIDMINVGEQVMAYNEATGELGKNTVTKTFVRQYDEYILLNGKTKVAPPHLFLSEGKWVDISELKVGDSLTTQSGQTDMVRSLKKVRGLNDIYNLEVAPYHTYIVDGYVVHNKVIAT